MDSLQITTGEKRIPIDRDGVRVGELVIYPGDVVFAEKYYRLVSDFGTTFAEYEKRANELELDSTPNGNGLPANTGERLQLAREACVYVREKIDEVFGAGTSQMVFGDTMKVEIFAQFFEGINPFLKAARTEKLKPYLVKPDANGKKPRKRK